MLGSINDHYTNSSSAEAVSLRALVTQWWADNAPEGTAYPYCVTSEGTPFVFSEPKGRTSRIDSIPVQFDVFDNDGSDCKAILAAIENCFYWADPTLTVSGFTHLGTSLSLPSFIQWEDDVFHGIVELTFLVKKVAT